MSTKSERLPRAISGDKLHNIGPKSRAWLEAVGIQTLDQLQQVGPVEVFLRIKRAGFHSSLNLLWALAGALHGCAWNKLPEGERTALLLALDDAEKAQ